MEGSSGNHAQDRHTLGEVLLVSDALSQLKARYGVGSLALAGFSSGGTIVANLLANRSDIRCAVVASAPLDLTAFYRDRNGVLSDRAALQDNLADPMQSVRFIQSRARIWVIGDPRDRKVPPSLWSGWVAEARRRDARVVEARTVHEAGEGLNPLESYHRDTSLAVRIAGACAAGRRPERSRSEASTSVAGMMDAPIEQAGTSATAVTARMVRVSLVEDLVSDAYDP
jgi:pimeloyl-ACP methyl ester carboxylesterase